VTRAALYARFSSDLQDNRSIVDQIRDLKVYAERQGWTIAGTYTDAAVSGSSMMRAGIQALIADAAESRFDVVLAEALDRLSRDLGDTAQLHKLLVFHQVKIHTLSEGDIGKLQVGFKGMMNDQFLEELARKIRRGQRGNIARGLCAGGKSYGYDVVKRMGADGEIERGRRAINEAEAAVIRRIFGEYIAGVSPLEIARRLNAENVPSRFAHKGAQWSVSSIGGHRGRRQGILHNELYLGRLIYNRVTMVKHPETGKRLQRPNPREDWITVQVPELRIVDDDTWAAAQGVKQAHGGGAHKATPKRRQQHLLSGKIRCGACGATYVSRDGCELTCTGFYYRGTCDNSRRVKRAQIEARVLEEIAALLATPEAVTEATRRLHSDEARAAAEAVRQRRVKVKQLGDVKGKIARLVAAIEDGGDARALAARVRELEETQTALERELAQDAGAGTVVTLAPNAHEIYRAEIGRLAETIYEGDAPARAKKQGLIRALIEEIRIIPKPEGGWEWDLVGRLRQFLTIAAGNKARTGQGVIVGSGGVTQAVTPSLVTLRFSA
jgi:site-specific DNA recombinase